MSYQFNTTVTVTAAISEVKNQRTDDVTYTWPASAGGCTGAESSIETVTGTTASDSLSPHQPSTNSAAYRADLIGPTIEIITSGSTIQQGQPLTVGANVDGGSSGAAYKVEFTATDGQEPAHTLGPVDETDTFPTTHESTGIQTNVHVGPLTLATTCSTPPGLYTLTAKLDSNDLAGDHAYSTIKTKQFTVTAAAAGTTLESETVVVSELLDGTYGIDECFLSNNIVNRNKVSVNNNPGSVHIGEIVTAYAAEGECGSIPLEGVRLTLTLPTGFSYAVSGKSPAAHIFVFQGEPGFNLHYPPNEVTSLVNQTREGQTITINLSSLGAIASDMTVYARAKAQYTGNVAALPGQEFVFTTAASTTTGLSAQSDYTVVGNPAQGCVDGNFPQP
jgi:hypothetical protein